MINDTKVETIIKVAENIKKEDFEYILETIKYVNLWLIIFVLIIIKVVLIKTVKTCKKAYITHNERIIRQHTATQA